MAVLFAGNRLEHFRAAQLATDANPFSAEHTTANVDSAFTGAGVQLRYGSYIEASFAEQQTVSVAFRLHLSNPDSDRNDDPFVELYDASDNLVLAIDANDAKYFVKWGNLSTIIGDTVPISGDIDHYVLQYSRDPTVGRVKLFLNRRLIVDFTGNTVWGSTTGIAKVRFHATRRWTDWDTFSEVVIFDSLRGVGARVVDLPPNGAGFHTDWAGVFGSLSDGNTGTAITAAAVGDISSYLAGDLPAGDWTVEALAIGVEGSGSAPAPENVTLGTRVSSADYWAAAADPLDGQGHIRVWDTNPATGVAWTPAEIDAAELAIRAET